MEELLKTLGSLTECLKGQVCLLNELPKYLDTEEQALEAFVIAEFERAVIEKDQIIMQLQRAEERRALLLKRLCFLVSYDARGAIPGITDLRLILDAYRSNIKGLVDESITESFDKIYEEFNNAASLFKIAYVDVQPRVYRNQVILQKLKKNVSRSIALFESESRENTQYSATGKTHKPENGFSQLRVRA